MQESVMLEILRPFEWPRFVAQERAAAHRNHLLAEESDRPFRHGFGPAVANGEINQAPLEIERVSRGRDSHVDIGMKLSEAPQPRYEPERSEARRRGEGELASARFGSES